MEDWLAARLSSVEGEATEGEDTDLDPHDLTPELPQKSPEVASADDDTRRRGRDAFVEAKRTP